MSMLLEVGCNLTFNPWQVATYDAKFLHQLRGCGVPTHLESVVDPAQLGPWTTPEQDRPWWTSEARPASYRAAGVWPTAWSVEPSSSVTSRTNSDGCRVSSRTSTSQGVTTVNMEAIILGGSCCSTAHMVSSLRANLRRSACSGGCRGGHLRWPVCAPSTTVTPDCFTSPVPAETDGDLNPGVFRSLQNVVFADDLEVIDRQGLGCGSCGCGERTKVRWSWRASPGQHTDPITVVSQPLMSGAASGVCQADFGGCSVACGPSAAGDPNCPPFTLPPAAASGGRRCGCVSAIRNRVCSTFDLSALPSEFPTYARVTIEAASVPVRDVTVRFWQSTGAAFDSYADCGVASGVVLNYVPAETLRVMDGAIGDTWVVGASGSLRSREGVFGVNGLSWGGCMAMPCGPIVMCVDFDGDNPPLGASIKVEIVQVEPESTW